MKELAELLAGALAGGNLAALPLAIAGGVVTGFNPCCIPLHPAAAATCCATRGERTRAALGASMAFVAGIALATTVLGVAAALAGHTMTALGGKWRYLIAFIPLLMAVHLLGWVRLPMPALGKSAAQRGARGAFLAGLALSFVLAPCGTRSWHRSSRTPPTREAYRTARSSCSSSASALGCRCSSSGRPRAVSRRGWTRPDFGHG